MKLTDFTDSTTAYARILLHRRFSDKLKLGFWRGGEKMKFNPMTVALYSGFFIAAIHLVWSLMVAFGLGQLYLDWIFGLHFLNNPFTTAPFNLGTMLTLLVVTFAVGFVFGWLGTIGWNKMVKK